MTEESSKFILSESEMIATDCRLEVLVQTEHHDRDTKSWTEWVNKH